MPKAKRKLLITGDYTYMVTIPKEWVKQLGWRAKQTLELTLGKKEIRIKDFSNR